MRCDRKDLMDRIDRQPPLFDPKAGFALRRRPALLENLDGVPLEERQCVSCGRWFHSLPDRALWNCPTCLSAMGLVPAHFKLKPGRWQVEVKHG